MGSNKQIICITVAILTIAVAFGLGTGWLDRQARLIFDSPAALQAFSLVMKGFLAVGALVWLGAFEFHRDHSVQGANETES